MQENFILTTYIKKTQHLSPIKDDWNLIHIKSGQRKYDMSTYHIISYNRSNSSAEQDGILFYILFGEGLLGGKKVKGLLLFK